jgi:hypothetical protein
MCHRNFERKQITLCKCLPPPGELNLLKKTRKEQGIYLRIDNSIQNEEGFRLTVSYN